MNSMQVISSNSYSGSSISCRRNDLAAPSSCRQQRNEWRGVRIRSKDEILALFFCFIIVFIPLILSSTSLTLTAVALRKVQLRIASASAGVQDRVSEVQQQSDDQVRFTSSINQTQQPKASRSTFIKTTTTAASDQRQKVSNISLNSSFDLPFCSCSTSNDDILTLSHQLYAAHVSGAHIDLRHGNELIITNWLDINDHENILSGIDYRDGRLVAPENGLYNIYSQAYFVTYFIPTEHHSAVKGEIDIKDKLSLRHGVYRRNARSIYPNNGVDQLMLRHWTLNWKLGEQFNEYTSYLSGLFRLEAGDEIFVRLSNAISLNTDSKMTYFGLFRVK